MLKFIIVNTPEANKKKTNTYDVISEHNGTILGQIKWFSQWRRYTFHPYPATVFDASCLKEIKHFLDKKMSDWRLERKIKKEGL